jgi:hypothetical protein
MRPRRSTAGVADCPSSLCELVQSTGDSLAVLAEEGGDAGGSELGRQLRGAARAEPQHAVLESPTQYVAASTISQWFARGVFAPTCQGTGGASCKS